MSYACNGGCWETFQAEVLEDRIVLNNNYADCEADLLMGIASTMLCKSEYYAQFKGEVAKAADKWGDCED